jgi:hypothetical protein
MNMKTLICLAAALAAPTAAAAQDVCAAAEERNRYFNRHAAAVMDAPVFGETQLTEGTRPATRNLILARQSVTIAPKLRYLADAANLIGPDGQAMTPSGVPLGRGAPISAWRGTEGVKLCSIGWRNGLFGGATGDGHLRWICFSDSDGDGRLDNAWRNHSRNLGLSFNRLDIPVTPPVSLLDAPPEDGAVRTNARATLPSHSFERQIVVNRIAEGEIRLVVRIDRGGYKSRAEERNVALTAPAEVTLHGVTIAIVPDGRGGATVAARGAFSPEGVRLMCDSSRIVIGDLEMATEFIFPNW